MKTCNSCGGVLGVDCFNPYECAAITKDIEMRAEERVADIDARVRHLEIDIGGVQVATIAALHRIWTKTNPPHFEWTESAPTQEGWFWCLSGGSVTIYRLKRQRAFGNRLCAYLRPDGMTPMEEITNALWAGPIPQPTEP